MNEVFDAYKATKLQVFYVDVVVVKVMDEHPEIPLLSLQNKIDRDFMFKGLFHNRWKSDPLKHLVNFISMYVKHRNAFTSEEELKLRMFVHFLVVEAKSC